MGVQKPANTRAWDAPFPAEMKWKWRFEVCLYVLAYVYFSYHNTIYHVLISLLRVLLHSLWVPVVITGTGGWTRWKRNPLTAVWLGNREKPVWALILAAVVPSRWEEGHAVLTIPASPWESRAVRQGLAPLDMAAKGTLLGKEGY